MSVHFNSSGRGVGLHCRSRSYILVMQVHRSKLYYMYILCRKPTYTCRSIYMCMYMFNSNLKLSP